MSFKLKVRMEPLLNNSSAVRVLLVEDSLPVRSRIRSLIEEFGPVEIVGETGTAAGALALFHKHRPEAIVLDLQLADGTASPVLLQVKQSHPSCVVIVLTNFAIPECREHCRQLGADHFFDKSTEFERVPEVLAKLRKARTERGV